VRRPPSLFPSETETVPPGTTISYYTLDGQTKLYSSTPTATNSPFLRDGFVNTGNEPFALGPIYISNSPSGEGTTVFDY
jgi:hypothetical protein